MSKSYPSTRRSFLKKFAALSALTASSLPAVVLDQQQKALLKRTVKAISPNDRLQIATIGMGIIGFIDTVVISNQYFDCAFLDDKGELCNTIWWDMHFQGIIGIQPSIVLLHFDCKNSLVHIRQ